MSALHKRLDVAIDAAVTRGELADAENNLHDARSLNAQLQRELESERRARARETTARIAAEERLARVLRQPCIACGARLEATK